MGGSGEQPPPLPTVELISFLITLTHSIRVFSGRWQLIRSKLENLRSALSAAGDSRHSLSGEFPAIAATVEDCHQQARRCLDLSYSGKLLMQSDLDAILGKLEWHAKKLSEIHRKKGIPIGANGYAVVVSKPGLNASKEDMRFYLRDLLTRIKVGDFDMKKQALLNLYEIIVQDEKYVNLMLQVAEFVHVLLDFLGSAESEIQDESIKVVSVIAGFDSGKGVLVASGVIASLIRVLECGSELGKVGAAMCLQKLTENSDNAWSVSSHGGVTSLLKICDSEVDSNGELINSACGILRNLAGVEEIKRFMVEEGVVSTFIRLVGSADETVQVSSVDFIQCISSEDELVRLIVIREGGIRAFLRVLDPNLMCSSKTREIVMRAVENLWFSSPGPVSPLISYGFVDQLVYYVRNGEVSIQELALKVAIRLCGTSEEAKKALGDVGFMAELVKFLTAKSFEVREMAAEALSGMVMVPKNRKKFVRDDQNITLVLQLLDPNEGNSGIKKFLISILMSLTSCKSGRKKIVGSGYAKNIERLAEAEDSSDAKRLVRKLETNRFRSMLSGIWHS